MSAIYSRSFIAPTKRNFPDGRRLAGTVIRKMHRGEQVPAAMQKRAARAERRSAFGADADKTLRKIKKVHRSGRRVGLPQNTAQGDEVVGSKSVSMVKRARTHRIHVTDRMLSARELNKAFSENAANREIDLSGIEQQLRKRMERNDHGRSKLRNGYATGFRPMGKGLTTAWPRLNDRGVTDDYNRGGAPESSNSQWNDTHANTGAANDWHDQITPSVKPARVAFPQFNAPGQSRRDDAIEAIKQDLSKPKRMGASPNVDDSFTRER